MRNNLDYYYHHHYYYCLCILQFLYEDSFYTCILLYFYTCILLFDFLDFASNMLIKSCKLLLLLLLLL